ncbi:multidrug efflux MFS transporter [Campylobacter jejuni]|nr:multidrug efflux MFS transporter [Campylobacter jejuni]EDP4522557.1 multidrug efflux MFS transporter [Campylobacter jejuni]ELQ2583926.1 MFS transporter [Campylobacter jejuni]MBX1802921.1 MFS transporter [Campylobacter jejuni]MBX2487629.1 MFS transporter [Campylobacter jejuni]
MENFNRTLLVCWFGVFTTSMGLSQIAPILPFYIKELGHVDTSEIAFYSGLAFGITPLFMAVFSPLWAFLIACSFVTIYFFIHERKIQKEAKKNTQKVKENKTLIIVLFITTFVMQFGTFGVMPILSIYVEQIHQGGNLALWAGIVVAASGISNLFFAPKLGKIADKIGPSKIIFGALIFCGICFYLQAVVSNVYTLIFVRLLIGVGLGGLLPCVNALLKKSVSAKNLSVIFGFNQTCQFLGNFCGAFGGGIMASHFSVEFVFTFVCLIFIINAFIFLAFEKKYIFSNQGL